MRIGLYGIAGLYNLGCEAIVRGAVRFYSAIYHDAQFHYFSLSPELDRVVLQDTDIEVIPLRRRDSFLRRSVNHILKSSYSSLRLSRVDHNQIYQNIDILVSIGGDIFTIPRAALARPRYDYFNEVAEVCAGAHSRGIPVELYGASIGPFGEFPRAVSYYRHALQHFRTIYCREESTINYLSSIGITDNVQFLPDPALLLASQHQIPNPSNKIGINLSPLSLYEQFGSTWRDEGLPIYRSTLRKILQEFDNEIILIPHVVGPSATDNDSWLMRGLLAGLPRHHQSRIAIASTSQGFQGLKDTLRSCKFLIAARMHCALNALSENVPTLLIAYSAKSIGMAEYIYGDRRWVIDLAQAEEELIDKMHELDCHSGRLRLELAARNDEILAQYDEQIRSISAHP